jgi:hypothetical protein
MRTEPALEASMPGRAPYPIVSTMARLVGAIGEPDGADTRWLMERLDSIPAELLEAVTTEYQSRYLAKGRQRANLFALDLSEKLTEGAFKVASSDDAIVSLANHCAEACRRRRAMAKSATRVLEAVSGFAARYGVAIALEAGAESAGNPVPIPLAVHPDNRPTAKEMGTVTLRIGSGSATRLSVPGLIARLCDDLWWRRVLRKTTGRLVEREAIGLGQVHRHAGLYASNATVNRRRGQRHRNRRILEAITAVNEMGQEFTLQELADLSVSNPVIRRGELMTRIAGFEAYARTAFDTGLFLTLTCPSRMHPRLAHDGKSNPKFDDTSPRQAQAYLTKTWSRIRAKLARLGIKLYGIRIAEPQHDATPHWHLLVFVPPANISATLATFRTHALRVDGDEPGAAEHRFTSVVIDPAKGSAAGYIAKYVAKNIDGFGIDTDEYGGAAKGLHERVDAWASTWGIRQFQQLGGPPVSVWRELRRLHDGVPDGVLFDAWQAADDGDWHGFLKSMGGATCRRKDHPIRVAKQWSDQPGRYFEPQGMSVFGIESGDTVLQTRLHCWSLSRAPRHRNGNPVGTGSTSTHIQRPADRPNISEVSAGRPADRAIGSKISEFEPPGHFSTDELPLLTSWSPVNNCTRSPQLLQITLNQTQMW